jgi:hypothetical protein
LILKIYPSSQRVAKSAIRAGVLILQSTLNVRNNYDDYHCLAYLLLELGNII